MPIIHPVVGGDGHEGILQLAEEGASVVDIAHDRAFGEEDISTVTVHCVVETRDAAHIAALYERLNREGFRVV